MSRVREFFADISLPTPWPRGRRAAWWFVAIAVLGSLLLLVPRVHGWTGYYLFAEDGQVFLTEYLKSGFGTLFTTYAGYLHLVPRAITAGCASLAGPDAFAMCIDGGSVLVKVAVMAMAFPVMTAYAKSWRWGLAAASMVLLLPVGQQEVLGNLTNLRWFLLFGAFCAVIGVFRKAPGALYAALLALVAALSDPMPMLLAPIALWRLIAARGWARLPGAALLIGSAIHLLFLDPSQRDQRGGLSDLVEVPSQTIAQVLVRGPLVNQLGMTWTQDLLRLVGVPLAVGTLILTLVLVLVAWRARTPRDAAFPFAAVLAVLGCGFLLVTLSFPATYIALADIWSPSQPARYSVLTGLFLAPATVLLISRAWKKPGFSRFWAVLMIAVLSFAYIGDFGGDARHSSGNSWPRSLELARSECQGGASEAVVVTNPDYEGWRTTLDCGWLGVR